MDTLLILLAAVLLIAAVIVLVMALQRPKKKARPQEREDPLKFAATMPQFGPRQLGPGAIVAHGGIDYVVRGSVTLRQGPFVWWEHLLEGGPEPLWFGVEEDEGRLELVMWKRRKDLALQPGGDLVVDGVTCREIERGSASFTTEGTTGLPAGGEMDFVDYADADEGVLLGFERWAPDMPWEISTGRSVRPGELTVYPAPSPGT
ncbi:DUF4178 domain-containing protein [Mycolicibacterium flavescens]|uniref:DUF4178 domain-containing protein n=1 Tax=Mycolicibacterium flavescens TaxID=1776 RepID=A0A1E3RRA6_MYCFV|nr:DUF4178 domain-containing protein [Mycolicibacterium flavescens]MCV7279758.1 DUF4178 domain-containing protein [Mycolicibacterium flavescens]ODQ92394.1 hypothetical protein BHQ18_01255 [Mycolicibacterium flavescens]